jgi:hypothetical protein
MTIDMNGVAGASFVSADGVWHVSNATDAVQHTARAEMNGRPIALPPLPRPVFVAPGDLTWQCNGDTLTITAQGAPPFVLGRSRSIASPTEPLQRVAPRVGRHLDEAIAALEAASRRLHEGSTAEVQREMNEWFPPRTRIEDVRQSVDRALSSLRALRQRGDVLTFETEVALQAYERDHPHADLDLDAGMPARIYPEATTTFLVLLPPWFAPSNARYCTTQIIHEAFHLPEGPGSSHLGSINTWGLQGFVSDLAGIAHSPNILATAQHGWPR